LWLSALDALARDVRHILTPVIMAWMFATPVVYPSNAAPGALQYVVLLNPLTPVVEGFRWSILGMGVRPSFTALAVCAGVAVLLIVTGGAYFRAVERTIIDTM
jgi:lipopolysaccharide transport system permease protein